MVEKKKEKRNEEITKKKRKVAWIFGVLLIFLLIVLASLVLILLVQLGIIENPIENLQLKQVEFDIRDECSMIVGNLIHSVQDEDVCKQRCKIDCEVKKMSFVNSEFFERPGDCHSCKCKCK